jgi:CheY-like chemotaxis protein
MPSDRRETGLFMTTTDPCPPSSPRPLRVLLVDDSPEGRGALTRLLTLKGFEVLAVPDGTSALEALRTGPPPDVVLTDLLLPDIDGRQIGWHAHQLAPSAHVALITGWDIDLSTGEPQRGGFDRVFLKPLDARELETYLLDCQPSGSAPDAPAEGPSSRARFE